MNVLKRDGRTELYAAEKVRAAVLAAGGSTDESMGVETWLFGVFHSRAYDNVHVDTIHDKVEGRLMEVNHEVAKAYIIFREERSKLRAARMHPTGEAVAGYIDASKYCRWSDEFNVRETWTDACWRNAQMHKRKYPHLADEIVRIYREFVVPKLVVPSMRSMQFGGAAMETIHARGMNCSFSLVDRVEFFKQEFYLLLAGCGVGYSVQRQHVAKLPKLGQIDRSDVFTWKVEDTLEGWADALDMLIVAYMGDDSDPWVSTVEGMYLEFDYQAIRPKGTPLVTSGGLAPGHVPLKICLERVRAILDGAEGRRLRPIEVHDMNCHVAEAVLSGGLRRSSLIALFSADDVEMRECKSAANFALNPHRRMANNSAVFVRDEVSKDLFKEVFRVMREMGEPGFYFTNNSDHGCNPCAEIGLNPVFWGPHAIAPRTGFAFCNLSEINAAKITSQEDFEDAAKAAAFLGTLQAGYTDFGYLGATTRKIAERDALLGVSITGILDNPITRDPVEQKMAARSAVMKNREVADAIGINAAARVTTVKPSGTASLSMGCVGSGIHPHKARRYFRRVTANELEPCFQAFKAVNPHMCEKKPDGDWVITFPVEAPAEALLEDTMHGVPFMDAVFSTYENWVKPGTEYDDYGLTHNVSCTVLVKDTDDWDEIREHVWDNRKRIAAMAFAPEILSYPFLPREAVLTEADEAKWNVLIAHYQTVDYSGVSGLTSFGSACEGTKCEIGA